MIRRLLVVLVCTSLFASFFTRTVMASTPTPSLTTTPPVAPNAPSKPELNELGTGRALPAGSWVKEAGVTVRLSIALAGLSPQAEVEPVGVAFTGTPNYSGTAAAAAGPASIRVDGLQNGKAYHLQVRVVDSSGAASTWVALGSGNGPDIGVDQSVPSRPIIRSSTNPVQTRWYNAVLPSFSWDARDTISGVAGYSWVLERQPHVIPPGTVSSATGLRIRGLGDGSWYLALRAVDRAGNWSPTATFRINLDRQVPRLSLLGPNRFTLNPYKGPADLRFTVNKDAAVKLTLYRVGAKTPVSTYSYGHVPGGRVISLHWTGKAANGKPLQKGYYFFSANLVDRADNIARLNVGGITIDPQQPHKAATGQVLYPGDGKRIIVSLSRETLYAYDGDKLALQTFVTTGNPSLPTPTGTFTVLGKYHPYEFISPWPKSSPYYYTPSLAQYAMLFRDGGYFLHDAPWRSAFGPGTNGAGQPGTNYGGTHGCVNIPPGPMLVLWNWTSVGTTVLVVP